MDRRWKIDALGRQSEGDRADILAERLAEEMAAAWRRGECPPAEEFLARHPELCDHPAAAVRLIYEEFCIRQEASQEITSEEVVRRFPRWRADLEALLDCHCLLQPRAATPTFPGVGEMLGDFLLRAELGRGALGRVFLAVQPSLAGRPVVLKLTPCDGEEHLSLARLQHTHIVSLYSVHDFPARHLRALCMPYLGGATLAQLLEAMGDRTPARRVGRDLLEALDRIQASAPVTLPLKGRGRQLLDRASYAQAICWIGACLANALQYAHERGLVHLDLKPSNVLLGADGQPLLLDLHLAREPIDPDGPAPRWLGGSPAYMSPEQKAALDAVSKHQSVPMAVDGRSDVFSLGMILYEMLGGEIPSPAGASLPRLRRSNPYVTAGLSDILRKCLAHDPRDRYPDASALATDLQRHLADQPLQGVGNRSPMERWRKWRRRRPHALALIGMLLAVTSATLIVGGLALTRVGQRLHEARASLLDGQVKMKDRRYSEAVDVLTRGLSLCEGLPGRRDLDHELGRLLRRARRAEAAHRLHLVTDRLRFLYGIDSLPIKASQSIEANCRAIWEARARVSERSGAELEPDLEDQIQRDLLDLAILWADLRVHLASEGESSRARHEALRVLAEAEGMLTPSHVLYQERRAHAEALGLFSMARAAGLRAAEVAPRTAWDHYALGRSLLRSGKLAPATMEFERALQLQPQDFWPNFYQGICAYRSQRYEEAVTAFRVCIALNPETAECFYNRAMAYTALGQTGRALRDYDRALQLNPKLTAAALNRGILHYQERRFTEALADLRRALDTGADPAIVHYNSALVYLAQRDRGTARASLQRALRHNQEHKEARALYAQLWGRR
jgi:serine/threonine protein kinase/tetratricopeptide (TPR) repeat protein